MTFRDVRPGYQVYMLDKTNGAEVYTGKVTATGQPRFPQLGTMQPTQANGMVVDVTIEANGGSKTYSIPENSSVANAGALTLSVDREGILREVEAVKAENETELQKTDRRKATVAECDRILTEWNPAFAEKKKQDERITSLENEVKGLGSIIKDFINEFKK